MKALIRITIFVFAFYIFLATNTNLYAIENTVQQSISKFEKFQIIPPFLTNLKIPTVIEMSLDYTQNFNDQYLIVEKDTNQPQPYSINKHSVDINYKVFSNINKVDEYKLSDQNNSTYVNYEIDNNTQSSVVWNINYAEPIITNTFFYNLDENSRTPIKITIEKFENGQKSTILLNEDVSTNKIQFPTSTSSNWQVTVTYNQPLRVNEVGFLQNQNNSSSYYIRFLARPKKTYYIYSKPNTFINITTPESGMLDTTDAISIKAPLIQNNIAVNEPDSDGDGIFDKADNCMYITNQDQIDLNKNQIGDACEDFDNDTIINSLDNCPDQPNKNQIDTDGDGIGNHCDTEESRLTEKIKWLPWLGLIIGFTIVFSLLITTVKTKTPETPITI